MYDRIFDPSRSAKAYRESTVVTQKEYIEYEEKRRQLQEDSIIPHNPPKMTQEEFELLELPEMHEELLKILRSLLVGIDKLTQLQSQVLKLESDKFLIAKEPPLTILIDSTDKD